MTEAGCSGSVRGHEGENRPPKLTLYSRAGCHLCDELLEVAERVRSRHPFDLEIVDVDTDPALAAKYGHEVPVLLIDGVKAIKVRTTEAELETKLVRGWAVTKKKKGQIAAVQADSVQNPTYVESLEMLEPPPWRPPAPLAALIVAATIAGAGFFVARGVEEAQLGELKLTERLLRVETRDDPPLPFKLTTLDGKEVSLDEHRGKVVFLNFWATWCPPCVEEMPSMVRLHEKLKGEKDFVMFAVSADDSWDPVKKFFEGINPGFTVLLDAKGEIAKQYGTTMFPETYVVIDGKVRAFIEGPRDWDTWFAEAYLKKLLDRG